MKNNIHTKFILSPIYEILKDCLNATKGLGFGIETYPLCEYIMQTTFLKMTGASEQKLKCIVWELATFDYEFRYTFLKNTQKYGEYSSLDQKKGVFIIFKEQIVKLSSNNEILRFLFVDGIKDAIINKIKSLLQLFENTCIAKWQEKDFFFFKNNLASFITLNSFCNYENETLTFYKNKNDYEQIVFRHRNRCAHNLKSYQVNLPDLVSLIDENSEYQNYFFRFAILILLDEIFMHMYQNYLELLKNRLNGV